MKQSISRILVFSAVTALAGCAGDRKNGGAQDASAKSYQLLDNPMSDASSQQFAKEASHPKFTAETRFAAGQLAESEGRLDTAAAQYQEALRLDPHHLPSLYRLGIVYTRAKRFDLAIPTWKRYVEATRNSAAAYSNLGFCCELSGDKAGAAAAYQAGIARDPHDVACRTNYGLLLARQGHFDQARTQLSSVLPADQVAYDLATVYQRQGKLDEARRELKEALSINPANAEARTRLAALD